MRFRMPRQTSKPSTDIAMAEPFSIAMAVPFSIAKGESLCMIEGPSSITSCSCRPTSRITWT